MPTAPDDQHVGAARGLHQYRPGRSLDHLGGNRQRAIVPLDPGDRLLDQALGIGGWVISGGVGQGVEPVVAAWPLPDRQDEERGPG